MTDFGISLTAFSILILGLVFTFIGRDRFPEYRTSFSRLFVLFVALLVMDRVVCQINHYERHPPVAGTSEHKNVRITDVPKVGLSEYRTFGPSDVTVLASSNDQCVYHRHVDGCRYSKLIKNGQHLTMGEVPSHWKPCSYCWPTSVVSD